jgi:hypothetical protein
LLFIPVCIFSSGKQDGIIKKRLITGFILFELRTGTKVTREL